MYGSLFIPTSVRLLTLLFTRNTVDLLAIEQERAAGDKQVRGMGGLA
jgi:hypothetical protein